MTAPDWLTYDDFSGRVGERFDVVLDEGQTVPIELTDASQSSEPGGPGPEGRERLQFSLYFRGPTGSVLPQGTFHLQHPDMGELDLFLVPLGPDADGMRYEAAFA